MKKLVTFVCILGLSCLEANVSLNHLIEADKTTCLEKLENATDAELWDVFLEGQATLFFESEFVWFAKGDWWQEAKNVLELGSGNGSYLYKLSQKFPDKMYKGVEKLSQAVKDANERYARSTLIFQEGDAEIFDEELKNSADIVLFRVTLQHLENPYAALENAFYYLTPNGYVVILDSFDKAHRSSHPITAFEEALALVAEVQKKAGKGNRKITFDLLQALEADKPPFNNLYEVVCSNIDINGDVLFDCVFFQGEKNRRLYFNNGLLFLTLVNRTYEVPVNLSKAYDELHDYLYDENAWTSPGMHFLVLKKR